MNRTLSLLAFCVLAVAALELFGLRLLRPLDNRLLDTFVRSQAAALAPDPEIILIDIDEKSLANMEQEAGRWPWPRVVHAALVQGLGAQKPRAIVFDIPFVEKDSLRPNDDAAFVEAVAGTRNTYFPLIHLPLKEEAKGIRIADFAGDLGIMKGRDADLSARAGLIPPLILPREQWRVGLIPFTADEDGVGRRYLLREVIRGWQIPSLPARIAFDLGYPVPDADDMVLAWRGAKGAFRKVSYSDLYEDFNKSKRARPADEFTGKIVIVGAAASALQDLRTTPIDGLHPGAEILGTAIDNLKNGRRMRYADAWWPAAIGIVLVFLLYIAFQCKLDARLTGFVLVLVTGTLLLGSYIASGRLLLLPMLTPLVAREAVTLFSRFVNPEVVKQLIERGGIEGAGQQREVTLLFSDIRGFTSLSEKRRPEEVVALLNRYFSLQVDVVFRHGGSLDKFIGDCIMALWGAPLDDRDHARRAVACALDMADTLAVFKREFGEGATDFDVGIGVHSGPAVVGLIGSEKRREYTAIGDTVNLASRIEGLTKDAKRRILVSRDTMEQCADAFDFVSCGTFPVKGRAQPVELFEPRRKP